MGLDYTCHQVCGKQVSNETCSSFSGCRWDTEHDVYSCMPGEAGGGKSTIWIGVILSLLTNFVINIGMNAVKYAHNINTNDDGTPIKSFVVVPWWWVGVVCILVGEVGNVIAYGYAPASIVTPMGAIGIVTNVIITTYVLKEPFSKLNAVGVCCVIGGIVTVVLFAPRSTVVLHAQTIWADLIYTHQFLAYIIVFFVLLISLLSIGKKYGERNVFVYIGTCAVIASMTIVSSKTFSSILSQTFATGDAVHWKYPAPYLSLIIMVGTAVVSMGFVNSAMMHFGNSVVVPTYYAMFTVASVASVAVVYREFDCMTELRPGLAFLGGIILTVVGVGMLQSGKSDVVVLDEEDAEKGTTEDHCQMATIQEEPPNCDVVADLRVIACVDCFEKSPNFLPLDSSTAAPEHPNNPPPDKSATSLTTPTASGTDTTARLAHSTRSERTNRPLAIHTAYPSPPEGCASGCANGGGGERKRENAHILSPGLAATPNTVPKNGNRVFSPRSATREGFALMSLRGAVLTMPLSRTPRVAGTPRAADNTPCTTPPPSAAATPRFLPRANYMAEMPLLMHLTSQYVNDVGAPPPPPPPLRAPPPPPLSRRSPSPEAGDVSSSVCGSRQDRSHELGAAADTSHEDDAHNKSYLAKGALLLAGTRRSLLAGSRLATPRANGGGTTHTPLATPRTNMLRRQSLPASSRPSSAEASALDKAAAAAGSTGGAGDAARSPTPTGSFTAYSSRRLAGSVSPPSSVSGVSATSLFPPKHLLTLPLFGSPRVTANTVLGQKGKEAMPGVTITKVQDLPPLSDASEQKKTRFRQTHGADATPQGLGVSRSGEGGGQNCENEREKEIEDDVSPLVHQRSSGILDVVQRAPKQAPPYLHIGLSLDEERARSSANVASSRLPSIASPHKGLGTAREHLAGEQLILRQAAPGTPPVTRRAAQLAHAPELREPAAAAPSGDGLASVTGGGALESSATSYNRRIDPALFRLQLLQGVEVFSPSPTSTPDGYGAYGGGLGTETLRELVNSHVSSSTSSNNSPPEAEAAKTNNTTVTSPPRKQHALPAIPPVTPHPRAPSPGGGRAGQGEREAESERGREILERDAPVTTGVVGGGGEEEAPVTRMPADLSPARLPANGAMTPSAVGMTPSAVGVDFGALEILSMNGFPMGKEERGAGALSRSGGGQDIM